MPQISCVGLPALMTVDQFGARMPPFPLFAKPSYWIHAYCGRIPTAVQADGYALLLTEGRDFVHLSNVTSTGNDYSKQIR